MVTLAEALAAARSRLQQTALTTQQIGQAVLEALAQRLTIEPIPGWLFLLDGQEIRVFRLHDGARQQVGKWTVDEHLRLVTGEHVTEWVTAESYGRVIDEAVAITAKLIVDAETAPQNSSPDEDSGIVELPPRF